MVGKPKGIIIKYFEVQPYSRPFDNAINKKLNIVLSSDVKDTLQLNDKNVMPVNAYEFRKSVMKALDNTFKINFTSITYSDHKIEGAVNVVIYRFDPAMQSANGNSRAGYAFGVDYDITIFNGLNKLGNINDKVVGDKAFYRDIEVTDAFEQTIRLTCEQINKKLFTDSNIEALSK